MKRSEYLKHLAELKKWSEPSAAGQAKALVRTALQGVPPEKPVLAFPFGKHTAVVNSRGQYMEPDTDDPAVDQAIKDAQAHVGWLVNDITQLLPEGAAPTNKVLSNGLIKPCGVCMLVGGGDTGKTPLGHLMAGDSDADYDVLRYGEPLAGYINDPIVAARRMAQLVITETDIVLDSVKDILALLGGGAMKSGISRQSMVLLSTWSTIAANAGCTIYVPINPSSDDPEVIELLMEATKSNATSAMMSQGNGRWDFVIRTGEGLPRRTGSFHTGRDADDMMIFTDANGVGSFGRSAVSSIQTGNIDDRQLSASIRRSISATV